MSAPMITERESPRTISERVHPLTVNERIWGYFVDGTECRRAESMLRVADDIRLVAEKDPHLKLVDTLIAIREILLHHTATEGSVINLPVFDCP